MNEKGTIRRLALAGALSSAAALLHARHLRAEEEGATVGARVDRTAAAGPGPGF